MTVNTVTSKITYAGDGATTSFSFSFALTAPTDIQLLLTDTFGHVNTVPGNLFSVTINAPIDPNPTSIGGMVNYPLTGPALAVGTSLTIVRILPETQTASIANQSIVYPPVIEQALDRLLMIEQGLTESTSRAISVPISDPNPPPLPPAALRANTQAVFDSSGNMTAGGAVIGTIISAPMIPVVTAPTLALARTAMSVPPIDSPVFTGDPQAPTAALGDNDTSIATTQFVQNSLAGIGAIIASGSRMIFQQSTAPVGWTKDTTHNDKALRLVSGAVGTGGFTAFSTVFSRTTVDPHTLTLLEMPTHEHTITDTGHVHIQTSIVTGSTGSGAEPKGVDTTASPATGTTATQNSPTGILINPAGSSGSHTHGMDNRVLYVDFIICQKT